jgi:alkanesulfonate monooxygenase SsuD/methylene tetrahydromethanopterin reductase-like flavin-dependent oxidoreductase (luciferase family)
VTAISVAATRALTLILKHDEERGRFVAPISSIAVRIGLQLPEVERDVRWQEVAAIARAAEESRFDSIWVGDHLLYRGGGRPERGPHDAWTQLAALAVITTRVRLGPLVAATPFHPPGVIARMAASIDEISGGRFTLGLGAGWNELEFRAFGFPFDHTVSRFEESFEIIRRLLRAEHVTFEGEFHSVEDAVLLPPPRRTVPIMLGSNGPRMLSIALPYVDAWNTWFSSYGNTVEGFANLRGDVDSACVNAGRDPGELTHSACVLVRIGDGAGERPHDIPPIHAKDLASHLRLLAEAGADEAILVLDPIDERSTRQVANAIVDFT